MSSTSWSPRHVDLLAMHTRLQFRVVQKLYTSVQALAHGAAPPVRIPSPACDQPPRLPSPAPRSAGPVPWGLRNATTGACVSTPRAPPPCTCFAGRERRGAVFTHLSSRETGAQTPRTSSWKLCVCPTRTLTLQLPSSLRGHSATKRSPLERRDTCFWTKESLTAQPLSPWTEQVRRAPRRPPVGTVPSQEPRGPCSASVTPRST